MVTAVFNCGDYAETKEIWQWDYGQVLRIQGLSLPTATEIHFALQEAGGESATRIGVTKDGVTDVTIPDSLLENDGTAQRYSIYAFIYLTDGDSGQTIKKITIPVKSRPKPQAFDKPEDAQLFRDAIKAVNDAADRAVASEKLAEGWAHGREDMPERAQDNAMYYAGKASEDARQTAADRKDVKELVDSVSGIEQQVETIKGYADQAKTAADEAAKSQESSEGAAKAAGESATAAELSRQQAGQYATDAAERASDASDSADQASGYATKAGQAYTSTVELSGRVQTVITQTGETQVQAINLAGATQVQAIKSEGAKQVQAVQDAAQEIAADREQIKTNKEDIADLKDQILPLAIKATSDKAEILNITDSADFKMLGFNLYGRTEQVQTKGDNLWPMFKDGELSGVKLTVNKDGSVTLNGTCTRSDIFYQVLPVYPTTYTLSCDYTGVLPQNQNTRCQINAPGNVPGGTSIRNDAKPDTKVVVTFEKYSEAQFWIRIENGHTYNNVTLRPMLYYGTDVKPFEPITGGFPSPRPQMRSRNLFDISSVIESSNIKKTDKSITVSAFGVSVLPNDIVRKIFPLGSSRYFKFYAKRTAEITDGGYTLADGGVGFLVYNNTSKKVIGDIQIKLEQAVTEKFLGRKIDVASDAYSESDEIQLFAYTQRLTKSGEPDKYNTWEFSDIMISEEDIPYEPYLIPEWPQPINHAGRLNEETGKYEVQVKVTGKNLLDIEKVADRDNWKLHKNLSGYFNYPVFVGKGNLVTISYPEKLPLGHGFYLAVCLVDSGNIVGWLAHTTNADLNHTKSSYTATTDYIYITAHGDGIENIKKYFSNLQVEYGTAATPYEPYKEQSITLTSDRALTKWDKLDRRDGVWGWVYGGKIYENFNGDGHAVYMGSKVGDIQHFRVIFDDAKDDTLEKLYCNKFLAIIASYTKEQYAICSNWTGGTKYFSAPNENITTVDEFKQWLKNNPLCLAYQVKDSTFHLLPQSEQQALNALVTYYPTTIITNNVNAQMQAQYVADPANYIANHYVSKEDTQAIMQRISNIETAMLKL